MTTRVIAAPKNARGFSLGLVPTGTVGVSGTQIGMNLPQRKAFVLLLRQLAVTEFHHGDCIGVDAEAHALVRSMYPRCKIIIHPPIVAVKRAFCRPGILMPPRPYLARNKDIVTACLTMIIVPKEDREQRIGSGTWATYRYSVQANRQLHLIQTDGTVIQLPAPQK